MILEDALVLSNIQMSENTYLITVLAKGDISSVQPGQFFMLKCKDRSFILRRPISVHYADKKDNLLEFYYEVKGKGTKDISSFVTGEKINIQGPLGNGFDISLKDKDILLIGGGMGIAPLKYLSSILKDTNKVTMILGSRNSDTLGIIKNLDLKGISVFITTDDGSVGIKGPVTAKMSPLIGSEHFDVVYTCGPFPMMEAVAKLANENNIKCYMSLEARMACGVKACVGCSVKTKNGMKKVCHDGPVFLSNDILFTKEA